MPKEKMSNRVDEMLIMAELEFDRTSGFRRVYGGLGNLYKADTSCTGFMESSARNRLKFAEDSGMFAQIVGEQID